MKNFFLNAVVAFIACLVTGDTASADIVSVEANHDIFGNATVGRNASVATAEYDLDAVPAFFGIGGISRSITVGPVAGDGSLQFPGTDTTATSTATSTTTISSAGFNSVVSSSGSTSVPDQDAAPAGSYGFSSQSNLAISFSVDAPTPFSLEANITPGSGTLWQISLATAGVVINDLTNPGGGIVTRSGTLQAGSYTLRANTVAGASVTSGDFAAARNSTLAFNFAAPVSVPEPAGLTFLAIGGAIVTIRRRRR